ncbi:MAG: hypothetical protein HGA42_00590 [Nostocales cyanobacterium W4_Combined_metabat2_030]|nr:hypothetical protein [Nostocales cyanobacterium W4_Combined_metabat2_030]
MTITQALQIIQTYPHYDIDKEGLTLRKNLKTGDATLDLINSYLSAHGKITLVPKYMNGNAPTRNENDSIALDSSMLEKVNPAPVNGLGGFENIPASSPSESFYKILYEQSRAELSDLKRRYDDAKDEKHKAEIELVANKNGVGAQLVQGVTALAPALAGIFGGGVAGVGVGSTEAPSPSPMQQAQLEAAKDSKLVAIVQHYQTLDNEMKAKVYSLLAKLFSNPGQIDEILSLL